MQASPIPPVEALDIEVTRTKSRAKKRLEAAAAAASRRGAAEKL